MPVYETRICTFFNYSSNAIKVSSKRKHGVPPANARPSLFRTKLVGRISFGHFRTFVARARQFRAVVEITFFRANPPGQKRKMNSSWKIALKVFFSLARRSETNEPSPRGRRG